jgi:hypothetical protein
MIDLQGGVGCLLEDRVSDLATFAADVRRVANCGYIIDPEPVARLVDNKREPDPLAAPPRRRTGVPRSPQRH